MRELWLVFFSILIKIPVAALTVIHQDSIPEGYALVWHDEFNGTATLPDASEWWYETGKHGWGNHEMQNYIDGFIGKDTCALVSKGALKISLRKVKDEVFSVRMNTERSWIYGYFEARLKLPVGQGTWPAFG